MLLLVLALCAAAPVSLDGQCREVFAVKELFAAIPAFALDTNYSTDEVPQ